MSELNKLVGRKLSITSTMDFGDIIGGLESEVDAIDLVIAIDLAQQDGDFTIKLINTLFRSLRIDFDYDEGKQVIKHLKELNKSI